jgi:catechol 2,3-dioxygenase-like lactoylglutathione lyase family enzyme
MNHACLDHVGITVTSLESSLEFWSRLLSADVVDHRRLESPDIARMVDCDAAVIDRALLKSPFGFSLELLQYLSHPDVLVQPRAAQPGTVHVCIESDEFDHVWELAIDYGAVPVGASPISLSSPDGGSFRVGYVSTPDGVLLELKESPVAK